MGDKHFLLQNSLTGIILILFLIVGMSITNYSISYKTITFFLSNWQYLSVLILTPIIGIVVQGSFMFFIFKVKKRHPYQNNLRSLIANSVRKIVMSSDNIPKIIKSQLSDLPDDSIFMWILYSNSPEHIIEWGRRRRDFQHLGENWVTATIIGLIIGIFTGIGLKINFINSITFLIVFTSIMSIFWSIGLYFLRNKMKLDVEAMELASIYSYLIPDINNKMKDYLSTIGK